jgi:ribosomal protein L11 methyltransferase
MFRVTFTIHPDDEDDLVTRLHATPLTGIAQENRDDGLVDVQAWFNTQTDAEGSASVFAHATVAEIPEENWNAAWQSEWEPILIGTRWYLAPPNDVRPTPPHRLRLEMRPGLAFGNGDHPTTHLCLKAMEQVLVGGDTFLDVGCGSGLLGSAAELLGTRSFGCDLNPTDLPKDAFIGSVDAIADRSIDVAVMNIQAGTLVKLWPELARVARRAAILSGFLPEQTGMVITAIQPPWRVTQIEEQHGWCALVATIR